VKGQLESIVDQMYRAGMRFDEAGATGRSISHRYKLPTFF